MPRFRGKISAADLALPYSSRRLRHQIPRSRPQVSLLEGYLNVRSLNNSCSKDVCMKTFEGAQTIKKVPENTQLQLIP